MDDWIEIEGKSKSDAIERACNALNTNRTHLEYEVVGGGGRKIRARRTDEPQEGIEEEPQDERQPEDDDSLEAAGDEDLPPTRKGRGEKEVEEEAAEEEEPDEPEDTEFGQRAQEQLQEMAKHIEPGVEIERKETKQQIYLEISGGVGSGLFIGKHGQTLEALQHLLMKMSGLERENGKRIVVDTESYRARRQEALEALAGKLAQKAQRERRAVTLEPMSALDRRTLHVALANHREVTTRSVGDGVNRKVVVVPKRRSDGRGRSGGNRRRGGQGERSGGRGGQGGQNARDRNSGGQGGQSTQGRGDGPGGRTRRPAPSRRGTRPGRMHDSFDVPPEPKGDLFREDPEFLADEPMDETSNQEN